MSHRLKKNPQGLETWELDCLVESRQAAGDLTPVYQERDQLMKGEIIPWDGSIRELEDRELPEYEPGWS